MSNNAPVQKDWPIVPITIFVGAGYIWPFFDFIFIQKLVFQPLWAVSGVVLFVVGRFIEWRVRMVLREKAKFPDINSTKALQIVKDHRLITDGVFRYVRHPLYIGRTMLSLGWVLIFSSFFGVLLIAIGVLFFLPRIQIEEEMLLNEFGDAYRDYQRSTKKLIPYLY